MDPITHTCVGAGLSATGLRRTTALATPTLILAANAPDIDILTVLAGPYTSLALRRGITHGIPALLILPFVVTGLMVLWDRHVRRRRHPEAAPARPAQLLALAALGVWTHPVLDWLNNYGMRWLLPFDGRWSYGDAVFILDPWLWLLVVGPVFLTWSRSRVSIGLWLLLAGTLTLPIMATDVVPAWARVLWLLGILGWIVLRLRLPSHGPSASHTARWVLSAAVVYMVLMVAQTHLSERVVLGEAEREGFSPEDVMVAPVPADPLGGQVVLQEEASYRTGSFHWTRTPRVSWHPHPIPRKEKKSDPEWEAAMTLAQANAEVRRYLTWSRYPVYSLDGGGGNCLLRISDARYLDRQGEAGALTGPTIALDPGTFPGSSLCP